MALGQLLLHIPGAANLLSRPTPSLRFAFPTPIAPFIICMSEETRIWAKVWHDDDGGHAQVMGQGLQTAVSEGSNTIFGAGRRIVRHVHCPVPPAVEQVRRWRPRHETLDILCHHLSVVVFRLRGLHENQRSRRTGPSSAPNLYDSISARALQSVRGQNPDGSCRLLRAVLTHPGHIRVPPALRVASAMADEDAAVDPLHPSVQAVRTVRMSELRLSVHEDAAAQEVVLEDVIVPLPIEPRQKHKCGIGAEAGVRGRVRVDLRASEDCS